ncbi:hypothetical protein BBP40_010425 [Aspergillus hancockii]|nr:hypothetical protein BBP40_010425 [Aspergillus hancockii]
MSRRPSVGERDAREVQAWLIGAGVASFATAVHLIHDAKVPGSHIHILDVDTQFDTDQDGYGDAESGFNLQVEFLPFFLEPCTADLLSCIPSSVKVYASLLDEIAHYELKAALRRCESTGLAVCDGRGMRTVRHPGAYLRMQDRKDLLEVMLENEATLDPKRIDGCFSKSFFESDLWHLFSVKYALQPWHSAVAFHRHLCKYIEAAQRGDIQGPAHAQYTSTQSILQPIQRYLIGKDVGFRSGVTVTNLQMLPQNDPEYVEAIECMEHGHRVVIPVRPTDIVITTLGSSTSGSTYGCNDEPPPPISSRAERIMNGYWSLWFKLAKQSPDKFGYPAAFCTHIPESKMESFTVTMKSNQPMQLYSWLRQTFKNGSFLSIPQSPWSLCISLPCQPVLPKQPDDVFVLWGYALAPVRHGGFIKKPMCRCTGEEILSELLSHIGFPSGVDLSSSVTIPRLMPLATSALLSRSPGDRPEVIPPCTRNMAVVGQFCQLKDETASGMEHSVRSARVAVYSLMGLHGRVPK